MPVLPGEWDRGEEGGGRKRRMEEGWRGGGENKKKIKSKRMKREDGYGRGKGLKKRERK